MNVIKNFIVERAFTLMLVGMCATVVGVGLHMYIQSYPSRFYSMPWMIPASIVIAFAGLAVYVIGRVSLAMLRKRARMDPPDAEE